MYTIRVQASFSAAHHLRAYKGKCENQHGHNWCVCASVEGEALDPEGMLLDFGDLRRLLREVCSELDHSDINTHPYFIEHNPTAENIARWIFGRLAESLAATASGAAALPRVSQVTVEETDGSLASYSPPLNP